MSIQGTIDSTPALYPHAFVFAESKDWTIEYDETLKDVRILGVPGTWYHYSEKVKGRKLVLTLVCCPKCKQPSLLHDRVTHIDKLGKLSPDFACPTQSPPCGFRRKAYLDKWNRKPLYACALMKDGITAQVLYCHASTQAEARRELGMGIGPNDTIVGIAPAIGMFATDSHGEKLVADATQLKVGGKHET